MRLTFVWLFAASLLWPATVHAQDGGVQYWCNGVKCAYQDWLALQSNQPTVLLTNPAQVAEQERAGTEYLVAPAAWGEQAVVPAQDAPETAESAWGYHKPRRVEPYYDRSFYEQQASVTY